MVDWKLYIDSPQKRALHLCRGSLTEGDGWGNGYGGGYCYSWGAGDAGYGWGDGGGGRPDPSDDGGRVGGEGGWSNGDGRSSNKW